jgi:hypothetical protein
MLKGICKHDPNALPKSKLGADTKSSEVEPFTRRVIKGNISPCSKNVVLSDPFEPFALPPSFPPLVDLNSRDSSLDVKFLCEKEKYICSNASTPTMVQRIEGEKSATFAFLTREVIRGSTGAQMLQPILKLDISDKRYPEDPNQEEILSGALMRCEARVKRLDRLNALLESFSSEGWATCENRQALSARLRRNRFYPALQEAMLTLRLERQGRLEANCTLLPSHRRADVPIACEPEVVSASEAAAAVAAAAAAAASSAEEGLSELARTIGADVAGEVSALRMLERQTLGTVAAMAHSLSADVPVSGEDLRAMIARARDEYAPARRALAAAVQRVAEEKEAGLCNARCVPLNDGNPLDSRPSESPRAPHPQSGSSWLVLSVRSRVKYFWYATAWFRRRSDSQNTSK